MSEEESIKLKALVQRHCDQLGEHFDSVQILVNGHRGSEEMSFAYDCGAGNFYARYGQVTEWVSIQDQYQREEAKRRDRSARGE